MRARSWSVLVIATALTIVLGAGIAEAQMNTGESYLGEQIMNAIFHLWPTVAIVVLTALVAGGVLGVYDLGRATMLFLLAAAAFLAYHFYWQPTHPASVRSPNHLSVSASGIPNTRAAEFERKWEERSLVA